MVERRSKPVFDLPRWKQKWQDLEFDDEFDGLHIHYLYDEHMAYRGPSTIEEATSEPADENAKLLATVAWEACEAEARRWLKHGLDIPGPPVIADRMRRPLEQWGLKAYLGEHTTPHANPCDARDLFFYQAVRILQIITETDRQQRHWARLVAKVYNRLKPPKEDPVSEHTVRNGFRKFRKRESG